MRLRLLISACATLSLVGCSEKSTKHIGGAYYFETTKHPSILSEPGGGTFEFQLVQKKDGKTTVISKQPLAADIAFEWHLYGNNLAFIEGGSAKPRLVVFSEKKGDTIIDEDVDHPTWQITADDRGITCQRLDENLKPKEDSPPKFYSADYLKNL
jgi:hypothetical protein